MPGCFYSKEEQVHGQMKTGILGSGGIAHTMANTVKQMADVELYAVGARTLERCPELC